MAQPDPEIDSDEDEDDDDVKIVLLQPEEFDQPEGDGEEEAAHAEEGGEELIFLLACGFSSSRDVHPAGRQSLPISPARRDF